MGVTTQGTFSGFTKLSESLGMPKLNIVDAEDAAPTAPDGGPYCARCKGARWLKRADFDPRRRPDGQYLRCPDCQDLTAAIRQNCLAAKAGLTAAQRESTFEKWMPVPPVRDTSAIVRFLGDWADDPRGWVVLRGIPGSGKTHLGLAVANRLIAREQDCMWCYPADLVLRLRQRIAGEEISELENPDVWLWRMRETAVLILDDIGVVRATDWVVAEVLEPMVDFRYRNCKPTLFTMIGTPQDVREVLSDSIGRRMQGPLPDGSRVWLINNPAGQYQAKEVEKLGRKVAK